MSVIYGFAIEKNIETLIKIANDVIVTYCIDCGNFNEISKACAGCKIDEKSRKVKQIEDQFNRAFKKGETE